jgi:hypothetical protein
VLEDHSGEKYRRYRVASLIDKSRVTRCEAIEATNYARRCPNPATLNRWSNMALCGVHGDWSQHSCIDGKIEQQKDWVQDDLTRIAIAESEVETAQGIIEEATERKANLEKSIESSKDTIADLESQLEPWRRPHKAREEA